MKKSRYVPDLISDMAECDANYSRLHRLFPNLHKDDFVEFGVQGTTEDGALVTMKISERCPYTTMLSVTVESETEKPWIKWPSMELRVYHDLCTAEVISFERHRNFRYRYPMPNPDMYQPDEKSQINRFLGELLTFCLHHGFSLDESFS
tara:strand:- start:183 stop:629 length:447 start_codon:yes stop_codon:yes gene_type:complete